MEYRFVSLVPKLRFPEFTEEWRVVSLGDVGPVSMCKRIFKHQTSTSGDVPFYKIGTFGKTPDAFIKTAVYDQYRSKYSFPNKGDILISAAGTIGRLVVYDGEPAYFQDSNIVWIANDETKVINRFLHLCYLKTNWKTEDTTIARLYNDNLRKVRITAPEAPEQQKIADFLAAVNKKIELTGKKVELLKLYKKGAMRKIFTQQARLKNENGIFYPAWKKRSVGDIAYSETSPLSANKIEGKSGRYKVYGASGVLQTLDAYHYEQEYIAIVKDGAGAGRIRFCEAKSSVLGTLVVVQPKPGIDKKFLFFLLGMIDFRKYVTGSTIPHVYFSQYSKEEFKLPGYEEQRKIADILTVLDQRLKLEEKKLAAMMSFKTSLLQRMLV